MKPSTNPLFIHIREHTVAHLDDKGNASLELSPNGGGTIAFYFDPEKNVVKYAASFCNPKDNFNKKLGRIKAAGRLKSPNYVKELPCTEDALLKDVIHELKERVFGRYKISIF